MTVWTVPAVVLDIHDGDSIRCRCDLGWHVQIDTMIRIDGINAAELSTPAGKAARQYLLSILPAGSQVTIVSKKLLGAFEKYGRVLADVTFTPPVDARAVTGDVATAMLAANQAVAWDGTGTKPVPSA
jgi:endonuclease YncB( thermonuclease family)